MATENPRSHSPHIGEHSREILTSLGKRPAEIDALFAAGTVSEIDQPRIVE
jgi:crotonobetainyl-CoA:carnitine CoA-transferase CaiB-like acyl-CoA transferase